MSDAPHTPHKIELELDADTLSAAEHFRSQQTGEPTLAQIVRTLLRERLEQLGMLPSQQNEGIRPEDLSSNNDG